MHIQFDGGSRGTGEGNPGECGAGFVIADVNGTEIVRQGIYMGNGHTNNECESDALRQAFETVHALRLKGYKVNAPIRAFGDS